MTPGLLRLSLYFLFLPAVTANTHILSTAARVRAVGTANQQILSSEKCQEPCYDKSCHRPRDRCQCKDESLLWPIQLCRSDNGLFNSLKRTLCSTEHNRELEKPEDCPKQLCTSNGSQQPRQLQTKSRNFLEVISSCKSFRNMPMYHTQKPQG